MASISYSRTTLANMFFILRSSECPALAAFEKLSENNLKELANAVHISRPGTMREFIKANCDTKATLAELVYLEDAYQLAQSGEVDQVNQITDLQLRLVGYSKNILPFKELHSRNSFQIRVSLLAMFACRPSLKFETHEQDPELSEVDTSNNSDDMNEKIVFIKDNGVLMRF